MIKRIQHELNSTLICAAVTESFFLKERGRRKGNEPRLGLLTGVYLEEKQNSSTSMTGGNSIC